MSQFKVKPNQAALILDVSPEGEVTVEAAFHDNTDESGELATAICTVIGQKLTEDENFQAEILSIFDETSDSEE